MTRDRKGGHPSHESREAAALYALGALSPEEARAFERHVAEGCPSCAAEAAAFSEALVGMAREAETAPSPALRAKLLARLASERARASAGGEPAAGSSPGEAQVWKRWRTAPGGAPDPGLLVVRAGEGRWEPTAVRGVSVKPLSVDPGRRYVTMLVRMEPGSSYPIHRHAGVEECYVLQGELRVSRSTTLRAGDYQRAEAGSRHEVQSTGEGCLLLIVSSQDDELL